jgi:hypothetical protein
VRTPAVPAVAAATTTTVPLSTTTTTSKFVYKAVRQTENLKKGVQESEKYRSVASSTLSSSWRYEGPVYKVYGQANQYTYV